MKKFLIGGGVAAVVVTLALAAGVAGAQEGETPAETFLARVAEKLGVSSDELESAVKEVELEMVDEALADGRITEQQAERLRERIEEGPVRFPGAHAHPHPRACFVARGVVYAAAEVLGVETQEIVDGFQAGQSLAQIAEAHGMDAGAFQEALLAELQAELQQKVDDGLITQEQADAVYNWLSENIEEIVNRVPDGSGPPFCHGRWRPGDDAENDRATPEAETELQTTADA